MHWLSSLSLMSFFNELFQISPPEISCFLAAPAAVRSMGQGSSWWKRANSSSATQGVLLLPGTLFPRQVGPSGTPGHRSPAGLPPQLLLHSDLRKREVWLHGMVYY